MDERQPLLESQTFNRVYNDEENVTGKQFVKFDVDGDADNPRDWPKAYKWFIVFLLAFIAFTV
jgi:hypothetical protein